MQNLELYIQRAKYLEACEDKAFLKKEKEIDELSYEVDILKAREKITPKNSGYEELLDSDLAPKVKRRVNKEILLI